MNVIDLLILIIVVTILVTLALGVMTYVAYKLRMARKPATSDDDTAAARYFVLHKPPLDAVDPTEVDAS